MALLLRFIVIIPLILSFVAFVLTNLALFAGHQQGFMEDYAVMRLNTSMLGQDTFQSDGKSDSSNDSNDDDDDDDESLFDRLKDKVHDLGDDAKGKISEITGDIIDDIADELGISDWYSIHIMNACQGFFGANATTTHFKLNVTNCTQSSPSNRFNLTEVLNQELSLGPFDISLADISWPDSIQDKIGDLNGALLALFVFYVLGVAFSGLSMLACIPAFLLQDKKIILFANTALASLAAATVTLGSIVATAASSIAVTAINKAGKKVTLVASKGTKFYTITWIAAIFMMITSLFWVGKFVMLRRKEKKERERYSKERF
ncbi:actin cortical patch SUR7/pH-response regulator pali [Trichoderma ceciliae]